MIGPFFGLLVTLAVAALVGWGIWAMKRRAADPDAEVGRPGPSPGVPPAPAVPASPARGLAADLERWVAAGLITSEQAESIRAHERAAAAARPPAGERRISLIAEALGYVGTALALAGAAVGLGQAWEDIPAWGRLAAAAGATALLLLGGAILLRQTEPAFRRLQSVLWFLAVGAGVWFLVVLGVEYLGLEDDERMMLLVGVGSAVLAGLLWVARRDALQHAALFATLLAALVGAVLCLPGEAPIWLYALVVWALGVAWGLAGWFRVLEPWWLGIALGSVGAVVGPSVGIGEYSWLLALGLGTAVFLMAVSVPTGQVPLLAVGTLGTFGYLTWAVFHFFGDSLSVPVVLVIIGAVFIALAVVAGRLTQVTRGRRLRSGGEPTAG
jgi:hypothetical protein